MKPRIKISNFVLVLLVAGLLQATAAAQNTSTYYRQAYDQGFQAAQADANAGRAYNYQTALVTAGGLSGLSRDYRSAFQAGYQDGYYNRNNAQNSDYYYNRHRHNSDCNENGSPGQRGTDFNCRTRHDNGQHKGWYKNHGNNGNGKGNGKGHGRGHGNGKHDENDNERD